MSMFIFTIIFGGLCIICSSLGMGSYFVIIVAAAFIIQGISDYLNGTLKLPMNNIDNIDPEQKLKEGVKKVNDERMRQLEELYKKADSYDFSKVHQIPVHINPETKTYVIDVLEIVKAIDDFYMQISKKEDE